MKSIKLLILLMVLGTLSVHAQQNESLYISKTLEGTIESVEKQLTEDLKREKFGVITEVDMTKTLKEKIGVEIMPYKILGVCNAKFAHQALMAEENIGVFLPCKIILKHVEENKVEIVSANPSELMKMIGNKDLDSTARIVTVKLAKVINEL